MINQERYQPGLTPDVLQQFQLLGGSFVMDSDTGAIKDPRSTNKTKTIIDMVEEERERYRNADEISYSLSFANKEDAQRFINDIEDPQRRFGANEESFLELYGFEVVSYNLEKSTEIVAGETFETFPEVVVRTNRHTDWFDLMGHNRRYGVVPRDYTPEKTPLRVFLENNYGLQESVGCNTKTTIKSDGLRCQV